MQSLHQEELSPGRVPLIPAKRHEAENPQRGQEFRNPKCGAT